MTCSRIVGVSLLLVIALACTRPPVTSPGAASDGPRTDIARQALEHETAGLSHGKVGHYIRALDQESRAVQASLSTEAAALGRLAALNSHFFGPSGFAIVIDLSAPENASLAAVLDHRRGTCVGLAIVYLALAQRLGLDVHAVATPVHLFIRVRVDDRAHNVELLDGGREIDDDVYRRRYKIDDASIAAGAFMKDLTNGEVIAHLLSNQAVALSKQGKLDEALARYDAALRMHPKLVAGWYNRGIDLMNAGRLEDALASFDRAIELYPSDAQALNNRGLTRARLGDRDGARADFTRALELEPGMREAAENLKRLLGG